MLTKWAIIFSSLIFYSCSIPSAKTKKVEKETNQVPVEKQEPDLEDEIDKMLESPSEKKLEKLERLKSRKKDYTLDFSISYEGNSFDEDIDGETKIEGRMIGVGGELEYGKELDLDFDLLAYAKLGLYGDAEFSQTSRSYTSPNTISLGAFLIHRTWDRDIKPIIGVEREEISYVSADKEVDLSTVNIFEQISGTKGLFYNALLGAQYHHFLFDSKTIWTFMAGFSLLGEANSNKGELEQSLNSFKLIGKVKWSFSESYFLGGRYQYSSIEGIRSTTFYNYALIFGFRL